MEGHVLGYTQRDQEGVIKGQDGQRYPFKAAEWKSDSAPRAGMQVDFEVKNGKAIAIYAIGTALPVDQRTLYGVASLALTFFFGFIGTLISRLALAKQSGGEAFWPTIAHLIITVLAFIPLLGWAIYVGGTLYFMVQNYQLVMKGDNDNNTPTGGSKYLSDET